MRTLATVLLVGLLSFAFAQDCEAGFRLFDHNLLSTDPVCVPENPERIAMFETAGTEFMLLLDIKPVIRTDYFEQQFRPAFPDYDPQIESLFGDLPDAGVAPPNLEVLVEADPDLIVTYDFFLDLSDQLNAIAPTVFISLVPGKGLTLQNLASFHTALWVQDDRLTQLIADYEARATAFGEAVKAAIDNKTIIIGRLDGRDEPIVFFAGSAPYAVLEDAGWQPPPEFAERLESTTQSFPFSMQPISFENLGAIDGDYLFIYDLVDSSFDPNVNSEQLDTLLIHPIFNALSVVQNEQLYLAEGYWNLHSLIAQHYVIDEMWRAFTGDEPSVANPFLRNE